MNLYNCRKLVPISLLIFGLLLPAGIPGADAALLKDVRIGEYKGFTRVVFELDTPGQPPHIQPQADGVLTIAFDDTRPDLSRKIPVERSEHVRELKFWHRSDRLSISLQFDFDHFRFETFPLAKPPRIAVDIHPLTTIPAAENEITAPVSQEADTSTDAMASSPPAGDLDTVETTPEPDVREAATEAAAVAPENSLRLPAGDGSDEPPAAPAKPTAEVTLGASAAEAGQGPPPSKRPASNRLQFYLVVSLVIITIVILALLLLMLLARHRWTGDREESDVNEFLKTQDQRIASLNARIKEQFKRYEEA